MSLKYHIDEKKYRIKPEEQYIRINGWAFDTEASLIEYIAVLNGNQVPCKVKCVGRLDVQKKFAKYKVGQKTGFHIKVYTQGEAIPETFELYMQSGMKRKQIVSLGGSAINRIVDRSTISYKIDTIHIEEKKVSIAGWITSINGNDAIKIKLEDEEENQIPFKLNKRNRDDVVEAGLIEEKNKFCGVQIDFSYDKEQTYNLYISDGLKKKHLELNIGDLRKKQRIRSRVGFVREAAKHIKPSAAKEVFLYIKDNGITGLKEYIVTRVNTSGKPYKEWFKENKATEQELREQRETIFASQPKVSIIVPTYKTPVNYLREMIDSVINQSYRNWELCIADGSEGEGAIEEELDKYSKFDSRVKYRLLDKNLGIAENTNAALELATGEYIGLFDHDDILAPNALYEVVKALQQESYDIIYTDEDKISGDKKEHMDPNFKPDFSMDLFRSHNYITHFFVVKTGIIMKIGGFRKEYDGSQDYDLMFRCIENAEKIKHIPMILYHWRIHENSVAGDPASKMYAYEAGKRAIEDHLKRMNIDATVEHVGLWGMYHVKYAIAGNPIVSIIIPNKDHIEDLSKCIDSIFTKSSYKNFEIIIIENNSEEERTFSYYHQLENEHDEVKVVVWSGEFNYSAINNYGVNYASGEYLLFLNNDTEMITPDAIKEMLGHCMRDEVGAVGAKLLYDDDTVQHAGVVIGFGGYAGHVNTGIERDDYGYMVRARINCNYSAVTAACMMTKRSLFLQADGFDEQFAIACNDVDYCLKMGALGKSVIYNAFSEWYHYESKSRGYEDNEEKINRFESEIEKFQTKWPEILEMGDPYYNKNFPVTQAPFMLG